MYTMTIMNFISADSSSSTKTTTHKRRSGRKKFQETRHPVYRGVRQRKGKWVCEIREPHNNKSRLWLGTFSSPDMAARAYDRAAVALKGEHTPLNFPDDKGVGPGSEKAEVSERTSLEGSLGNNNESENDCVYFDEEELFNVPGLIDGLAEGLILTPPGMQKGFSWDSYYDDDSNLNDDHEFISLWND